MVIIHMGRVDFVIPLLVVISLLWEVRMCLESYNFMYRLATGGAARTFLHCYTASIFKSTHVIHLMDCSQLAALCLLYSQYSTVVSASAHTLQWTCRFIRTVLSPRAHISQTTHNTQPTTNTVKVLRCPTLCNIKKGTAFFKGSQLLLLSHLISTVLR